jgi:RNA recognition motif-containing protein
MNIFIGNLLYGATEGDVKKLFEGFGNVVSVKIVMRKGKPGGFGFVEMPDEQQALAAIAALNGEEFMGRVLHVEPARPKKEVKQDNWFRPVKDGRVHPFGQPGRYKGGRRTRSYRERHGLTGMQEEAKPRRRCQDNPMRWRKRKEQSKPWQKTQGESKPWKKTGGESKPRSKGSGRAQKPGFKGRRKPGGYKRRS